MHHIFPTLTRSSFAALALLAGAAQADPLRLAALQDLSFGAFSPGTGGSVMVGPSGSRNAFGGVYLLSGDVGAAAQYMVTGNANQVYTISLPSTAVLSSASSTMQINTFVSSPSATTASTGKLSGGYQVLKIGATLQVAANQAKGIYTGSFSVTIDNN